MMAGMLAAGDLPLETDLPWWMGLAILAFWLAVVVVAVRILQARRAARMARRHQQSAAESRSRARTTEPNLPQLPSGDERS
jgi:hypothetical protein